MDGIFYMYLRKSRADMEAESRGEGETLSKHRKTLFKLAKQLNINVTRVFEEIVSGESITHRPEMLEMLRMIESENPAGVLVMDIDRLGRGNMQEQGLILDAFRESDTKIITPRKTYDLKDEFDEEYSEFEAFMARKELKLINRRLQRGRIRSIEEGNYIGTRPPYGYEIHKSDRGERYLVPHPEQSKVIRMIFEWYASGNMGTNKIANQLNEMGLKSYTGKDWTASSILFILKNAVYIGRIQWKKKDYKKSKDPNKKTERKQRPEEDWIDVEGKHEPLISKELFDQAQEHLKTKYHSPYQLNGLTNPLAGLIKCEMCGASMVLRPYVGQAPHIKCYNSFCVNRSSKMEYVENALLHALTDFLNGYKAKWGNRRQKQTSEVLEIRQQAIQAIEAEITEIENQKSKLHDFLERGIYTEETFLERSRNLADRADECKRKMEKANEDLKEEMKREKAQKSVIPKIQNVLKLYPKAKTAEEKNNLLKSVLLYATYRKEKFQRKDEFTLSLFPKLPKA